MAPTSALPAGDPSSDCGGGTLPPYVMLDPGHSDVKQLRRQADRVLSKGVGRWILWDTVTRRQIAQGPFTRPTRTTSMISTDADLAGSTMLVPVTGKVFELRSTRDGSLLSRVSVDRPERSSGLSIDGGYAYSADPTSLRVWSRDGVLVLARPGNYYGSTIFADRDALYVAQGPTRTPTVETIRLDGTSTFSRRYLGAFNGWFTDGTHFAGYSGNAVEVYDRDGVLIQSVPPLGPGARWRKGSGHGRYFWLEGESVAVYELGRAAPVLTMPGESLSRTSRSGTVAGLTNDGSALVQLDLRGDAPRVSTTTLPTREENLEAYAAGTGGEWVINGLGGIYASPAGTPPASLASLGCGAVRAIAGAPSGTIAIATADGRVRIYDQSSNVASLVAAIPVDADALALSSDGGLLFALAPQWRRDRALRVFQLPSGTLLRTFAAAADETQQFSVSADGGHVARLVCKQETGSDCALRVSGLDGRVITEVPSLDPRLTKVAASPDGAHYAIFSRNPEVVSFYDATGAVVKTFSVDFLGFLDDRRFLATSARSERNTVLDLNGQTLAEHERRNGFYTVTPVGRDHFYEPLNNRIHRIADGSVAWDGSAVIGPDRRATLGVVTATSVIFLSDDLVYNVPIASSTR